MSTVNKMGRSTHGLDHHGDDWRMRAACSPKTAEWFWLLSGPNLTADNVKALALCAGCPVLRQCHAYEAANPQPYARIAGGRVWRDGLDAAA